LPVRTGRHRLGASARGQPRARAEPQVRADVEERAKAWLRATPASPRASSICPRRCLLDPDTFLKGARAAYEHRHGLPRAIARPGLLSRDVYEGFAGAIGDREARGEQMTRLRRHQGRRHRRGPEERHGPGHRQFVSELISATRDKGGEVIAAIPSASRK
jgi:predicted lipid-binding transport protein (Tim44 family)